MTPLLVSFKAWMLLLGGSTGLLLLSMVLAARTGVREPFGLALILVLCVWGMCLTDVMVAWEHDKITQDELREVERRQKWKKVERNFSARNKRK